MAVVPKRGRETSILQVMALYWPSLSTHCIPWYSSICDLVTNQVSHLDSRMSCIQKTEQEQTETETSWLWGEAPPPQNESSHVRRPWSTKASSQAAATFTKDHQEVDTEQLWTTTVPSHAEINVPQHCLTSTCHTPDCTPKLLWWV